MLGKRARLNKISENLSDLTYHKKDVDADTSAYNIVLNTLKKLDESCNPTMQNIHEPVMEGH